ncbi:LCM-domain-containing protein [Hypoxylon trugodes]|uniref:LCM-domain-containing protein n=1 Tax=Hypoxylon trugodes TaxID=326681 RepID=UPI00219D9559|nr:LCM-domain-containing protein [Hypoxylon trugodes]KAI1388412.1 LCM-domain-containing protein [Hypoxylon trugodes]
MPSNPSNKAQHGQGRSTKQRALDDLVMATNSSSIVSKRSVERIYYSNEPHFFRFFVKKFQRRAPLINRGYYIRLHVIDVAVHRFLERPSEKKKVVVNLGCGSDVLPWQCMTRYPDRCQNAKFIDIDFPDLIEKKCRVVQETPELVSPLTALKTNGENNVQLQSDQYVQIGCDLRRISDMEQALSTVVDIPQCEFMFVAEVSITYMETEGADSVIKWASTLGQAEFCLLEQILPDGEDHPFAKTMLSHFEKLKTPLKSVFTYPDLYSQRQRFASRGWSHVDVESLWQIWSNDGWLSADERRKLDAIEPFDEWEEFALFASHYCVVVAKTGPEQKIPGTLKGLEKLELPVVPLNTNLREYSSTRGQRRFGAAMKLKNNLGEEFLANAFGLGTNSRLRSYDVYTKESSLQDVTTGYTGPSSRMCHTITDLGEYGNLLVGGRTSPSSALRDCWLFDKKANKWQRVDDLPIPLYRHSITRLGRSNMALSIGGKSGPSDIFGGCLLYRPDPGWIECKIEGSNYRPVFGALLVSFQEAARSATSNDIQFHGVLSGGIPRDGVVINQILRWVVSFSENGEPTISFTILSNIERSGSLAQEVSGIDNPDGIINRFGASGFVSPEGYLTIVGGIIGENIVTRYFDILIINVSSSRYKILSACNAAISPRPMLIGVSTELTDNDQLVVMGGGATCFSMGTFWNPGCYTLKYNPKDIIARPSSSSENGRRWELSKIVELTEEADPQHTSTSLCSKQLAVKVDIPRLQVRTAAEFLAVLETGKPVVIEQSNLGSCVQNWSSDYIVKQLGSDREVVVHEANNSKMNFNSKNFAYVTKKLGDMMQEIANGHKLYLRALSDEHPSNQPANIKVDFPQLAADFQLSDALSFVRENEFSSVLRITGPVDMWLHYDVMANLYCQVTGSKRFILFPPSDVTRLSFAPGSSSSNIDAFSELQSPSLAETHPHEAVLKPGDILFLPPLWMHTATPLSNLGVAVNVFFRNLENGYSTGRDIYGNRDLAAYEKGRQDVARIANAFSKIPSDMREFYIKRLADELAHKTHD